MPRNYGNNYQLFAEYHNNSKSVKVRNKIFKHNIGLVYKITNKYLINNRYDEDIEQVASMSLLRSIERFNPNNDNSFSSYALKFMEGTIKNYLRDKKSVIKMPRAWHEYCSKAKTFKTDVYRKFQREVTDLEIANHLNITLSEWREIKASEENVAAISLNTHAITTNSLEADELINLIPYDNINKLTDLECLDQILAAVAMLSPKKAQTFTLTKIRGISYKLAAEIQGVSPITITRRIRESITEIQQLVLN